MILAEWESVETRKAVIFPATSTPANRIMREQHSGLVKYSETVVAGLRSTTAERSEWGREKDFTWGCVLACLHVAVLKAPADITSITLYLTLFLLSSCLSLILSEACCTFHSWEMTVYPGLNLRLPPLYLRHFMFLSLNYYSVSHETLSPETLPLHLSVILCLASLTTVHRIWIWI